MARKLRVYGWTGWRSGIKKLNKSPQTREILATTSKKRVREIAGDFHAGPLSEICETGNEEEIAQAMANPGVIFFHQIDEVPKNRRWTRASE